MSIFIFSVLETGRFNPAIKGPIKRIYVTKGLKPGLKEKAVAVYKTKAVNLDMRTITDVSKIVVRCVFFSMHIYV